MCGRRVRGNALIGRKATVAAFVIAAAVASLFVYPGHELLGKSIAPFDWGAKFMPWRLGLDLVGGAHLVYDIDTSRVDSQDRDAVASGLRDVIERRINLFGVSEPQVVNAKEGSAYRLIVDLAGVKNVKDAIDQIGSTPLLEFYETQTAGTSTELVPTALTGRYLKSARPETDPTSDLPYVSLEFTSEGGKIFEEVTARNVGKTICVSLDREINRDRDCARVNEKITGGSARLTGNFTINEVKKIVERLNAGALPAPITLVNQATVGASLGTESLRAALIAGALGTLLIMLFMIGYYRLFGVFASIALLMYIPFTLAVFKLIPGFTMSLAGIAGFVLSIGMAVDANILIFERTKEEVRRGIERHAAIDEGFRRAWPSIRDSNFSTIITSIILYLFTTGFIKGFGLALLVGVFVSMFSAITVTRTLLLVFVKQKRV